MYVINIYILIHIYMLHIYIYIIVYLLKYIPSWLVPACPQATQATQAGALWVWHGVPVGLSHRGWTSNLQRSVDVLLLQLWRRWGWFWMGSWLVKNGIHRSWMIIIPITIWLWLTVCHGKSPFLIGKPSINGPFSMAMLNNQMVYWVVQSPIIINQFPNYQVRGSRF